MLWFSRKQTLAKGCRGRGGHFWTVTEALQITHRHAPPAFVVPETHETRVSRVCKYCLKQETHKVKGHISKDEAIDIYAGTLS